MKRKLFIDDDDDDDDDNDDHASLSSDVSMSPTTFSVGRRKRVRYSSLERTLAHMTLGNAFTATSEDVDVWSRVSSPRPREQETLNVILPSSVEEPGTAASEPVDMEVEPILVATDTITTKMPPPHGVDDWESIASGQLDTKEMYISSAVLDCLRRQTRCPPAPMPLSSQTSQALVLYRAPRPPSLIPLEQVCDDQEGKPTRASVLVAHGDDVMEVE